MTTKQEREFEERKMNFIGKMWNKRMNGSLDLCDQVRFDELLETANMCRLLGAAGETETVRGQLARNMVQGMYEVVFPNQIQQNSDESVGCAIHGVVPYSHGFCPFCD